VCVASLSLPRVFQTFNAPKSPHLFVDVDETEDACIERKNMGIKEEEREKM